MNMNASIIEFICTAADPSAAAASLRAAIVEGLGIASGEGIVIWTGREGQIENYPRTGAVLHVEWAVDDQSVSRWYPTVAAARAALHALATSEGRVVDPKRPGHVDLTAPGCHRSHAWVEDRSAVRGAA